MRAKAIPTDTGGVIRLRVVQGACGKRTYARRKDAAEVAARMRREHGENVAAYHCVHPCHGWHVGHRPGEPRLIGGSGDQDVA